MCTTDTVEASVRGSFRLYVLEQCVHLHVVKLDDYKLLCFSPVCCFKYSGSTHTHTHLQPLLQHLLHAMPFMAIFGTLYSIFISTYQDGCNFPLLSSDAKPGDETVLPASSCILLCLFCSRVIHLFYILFIVLVHNFKLCPVFLLKCIFSKLKTLFPKDTFAVHFLL